MTNLLEKLIQNYFELYGTFEGITKKSSIAEQLFMCAEEMKMSVEDVCYAALGFKATDSYSSKESFDAACAVMQRDKPKLARIFNTNSLEEVQRICKTEGIPYYPKLTSRHAKIDEDLRKYTDEIMLFYWYFRSSEDAIICEAEHLFPVKVVLSANRFTNKKNAVTAEGILEKMVPFKFVYQKDAVPSVSAGLAVFSKRLKIVDRKRIMITALKMLQNDDMNLPSDIRKDLMKMCFASYLKPEAYKQMLVTAHCLGETYADFMRDHAIVVPDLFKAYEFTSAVFYVVDTDVFLYNDECAHNTMIRLDKTLFKQLFTKDLLHRVCDMDSVCSLLTTETVTKPLGGF